MTTDTYVYIATDKAPSRSFVGVTSSLLRMDWIAEFGVDNLVWFDSCSNELAARKRMEELRAMTEEERAAVFLEHNPDRLDLYHRIQCSDPY